MKIKICHISAEIVGLPVFSGLTLKGLGREKVGGKMISQKPKYTLGYTMIRTKLMTALACAGAITGGSAIAGPYTGPIEPAPQVDRLPPPPPPADLGDSGSSLYGESFGGTLEVGYNTDYIWRGINRGNDQVWAELTTSITLGDDFAINLGAWYSDIAGDNNAGGLLDLNADQELQLFAEFDYSFGPLDLTFGYRYYWFDEHVDDFHEVSVGTTWNWNNFDFGVTYHYEMTDENHYIEAMTQTRIALGDSINLVPQAFISWGDGEIPAGFLGHDDDDLRHVGVRLGLEIALTDNATLLPYVAYTHDLDALEDVDNDEDDHLFGGVSLRVSF